MKKIVAITLLLGICNFAFAQRATFKYSTISYDRLPMTPLPKDAKSYSATILGITELSKAELMDEFLEIKQLMKVNRIDNPDVVIQVDLGGGIQKGYGSVSKRTFEEKDKPTTYTYFYTFKYSVPLSYSVSLKDGSILESKIINGWEMKFEHDCPESYTPEGAENIYYESRLATLAILEKDQVQEGMEVIKNNLDNSFSTCEITEIIYVGKAEGNEKKYNYADIDEAYNYMLEGLGKFNGRDFEGAKTVLSKVMPIYEKALRESDVSNKNARINEKVTGMITYNMALAYFLMDDFESAEKCIGMCIANSKGLGDDFAINLKAKIKDKKARYIANGLLK